MTQLYPFLQMAHASCLFSVSGLICLKLRAATLASDLLAVITSIDNVSISHSGLRRQRCGLVV